MNKFFKKSLIILSGLLSITMSSCSDIFDTDSDRLLFEKDHNMSSINDTLYSMAGILSALQPLADRYVLQNELRGDLLTTTSKADVYLQEINNFNYSHSDNPYRNTKDYYTVINNCNYVINNIDTTTVINNKLVTRKFYVAAKSIRAWAYFQLGLNYNYVKYYSKPILEVADIANFEEIDLEGLIPRLIADLLPYRNEDQATLGAIAGYNSSKSFYPVRLILGDLYLTRASMTLSESDYEMAAQLYFDQITEDKYGNEAYNRWRISTDGVFFTTNSAPTSGDTLSWRSLLYPERSETTGAIVNSMQYGYLSQIMTMNDSLEIIPTQNSIENFDSQNYTGYVYNASGKTEDERNIISRRADKYNGDLRKYGSLYSSSKEPNVYDKYIFKYASRVSTGVSTPGDEEEGTETEYTSYYICPLIREQTVFLRYAESLNKLGKPNMAMAILKYDFSYRYFNYDSLGVVPKHEKVINYYTNSNGEVVESVSLPTYANVTKLNNLFNNTGIRKHGCGNVDKDSRYAIPDFTRYDDVMIKDEDGNEELVEVPTKNEALMALAKNDSIAFVDSLIFVEYGLETAYEGNRFFDIYRYAKRYKAEGVNDNFFGEVMSKKVTDVALTKEFFLNEQNWFIPEEGK